jgi:hypothetical protein
MRRLLHRRAVDARDEPAAGKAVHALEVRAGVDRNDAGRFLRLCGVDPRMRACACGERRKNACAWRAIVTSSVNCPRPSGSARPPCAGPTGRCIRFRSRPWRLPYFAIAAAPCATALTML